MISLVVPSVGIVFLFAAFLDARKVRRQMQTGTVDSRPPVSILVMAGAVFILGWAVTKVTFHVPLVQAAVEAQNRDLAVQATELQIEAPQIPSTLLPPVTASPAVNSAQGVQTFDPIFVYLGQCEKGKWIPKTRKFVELPPTGCADVKIPSNGLVLTSSHGNKIRRVPSVAQADAMEVGPRIRTGQRVRITKVLRVPIKGTTDLELLWGEIAIDIAAENDAGMD